MAKRGKPQRWVPYKHDSSEERMPRGLYYKEILEDSVGELDSLPDPEFVAKVNEPEKLILSALAGKAPNLIGSKVEMHNIYRDDKQWHAPVIDLDMPCRLLPSSTLEHYHLYIDQAVEWENYAKLLKALRDCHFISFGYYQAAMKHKETYVRWGTTKQQERSEDG